MASTELRPRGWSVAPAREAANAKESPEAIPLLERPAIMKIGETAQKNSPIAGEGSVGNTLLVWLLVEERLWGKREHQSCGPEAGDEDDDDDDQRWPSSE